MSSDIAAQLTTKAEAAVAGGTVYRVETDAGDAAYEVHMTKADGSLVTVKFDRNLAVTAVEDGMGKGDPALAGGPQGGMAPSGQASNGRLTHPRVVRCGQGAETTQSATCRANTSRSPGS